jgi:hypothetical protein
MADYDLRSECFGKLAASFVSIYVTFAFDIKLTELCRGRASESTSIEELAMHRSLAVHVRDRFLGPGVVRSARAGMVATAVEVSLKYPQIKPVSKKQTASRPQQRESSPRRGGDVTAKTRDGTHPLKT